VGPPLQTWRKLINVFSKRRKIVRVQGEAQHLKEKHEREISQRKMEAEG